MNGCVPVTARFTDFIHHQTAVFGIHPECLILLQLFLMVTELRETSSYSYTAFRLRCLRLQFCFELPRLALFVLWDSVITIHRICTMLA